MLKSGIILKFLKIKKFLKKNELNNEYTKDFFQELLKFN